MTRCAEETVGSNEKRYITKIGKIVIEQEEGLVARDGSDQYEEIVLSDSELMEDGYFDFTDEDGHFDFTDRVRDVYEVFLTDLHYRNFKKLVAQSLERISEQDYAEALAILLPTGPKLSRSTLEKFNALTRCQQEEILRAAAKTLARINE